MYSAVILMPLLGAALAGLILAFAPKGHGRDLASQLVTCICMGVSALLAIVIFYQVALLGHGRTVELFPFVTSGSLQSSWAFKFDTLSAVMIFVVSVCSTAIHVYCVRLYAWRHIGAALHGVSQPVHLLHADACERR